MQNAILWDNIMQNVNRDILIKIYRAFVYFLFLQMQRVYLVQFPLQLDRK